MRRREGMKNIVMAVSILTLMVLLMPFGVMAHCDTMEGPVVIAAKDALETGDVEKVLIWVQPADEQTVREAFLHTREVRALSGDAASLADRYFFETLVRLHRAGEGAPYTGLKEEMEPEEAHFIEAGDAAIASGDDAILRRHIMTMIDEGLASRFDAVYARKDYTTVEEGQDYVEAYVLYQHYVEGIIAAAGGAGHEGHAPASASAHDVSSTRNSEPGWWQFWA